MLLFRAVKAASLVLLLPAFAIAQASPPLAADQGTSARHFDISQVTLNGGRYQTNHNHTMSYLKSVDPNRMLYVFR